MSGFKRLLVLAHGANNSLVPCIVCDCGTWEECGTGDHCAILIYKYGFVHSSCASTVVLPPLFSSL